MIIISAFIGLIAGILLTILSEASKKATLKRYSASKLYAETILLSKEIIEADLVSFAALSDKVYSTESYEDIAETAKKLEEYVLAIRTEILKNPTKLIADFSKYKTDPLSLDKQIYLYEIFETRYKSYDLILNKSEIACLSTSLQPKIIELIDNYFHCANSLKYFLIRIKTEEINIERNIDDFLEAIKYLIKAYKDRKQILEYSKELSGKSFVKLLFD